MFPQLAQSSIKDLRTLTTPYCSCKNVKNMKRWAPRTRLAWYRHKSFWWWPVWLTEQQHSFQGSSPCSKCTIPATNVMYSPAYFDLPEICATNKINNSLSVRVSSTHLQWSARATKSNKFCVWLWVKQSWPAKTGLVTCHLNCYCIFYWIYST